MQRRAPTCKYVTMRSTHNFASKPTGDHKPKRTLNELADELGVTSAQLRDRMRRSSIPAPVPSLRSRSGLWFDPALFKAWHKAWLEAHKKPLDAKA